MSATGRQSFWQSLGEPQSAISLVLLYCAVAFLARFLGSPNLNAGEAGQMLFGQSFQWGYQPDQPPLMTWLSWAVLTLSGNSKLALFLLRELLLALGFIAYFAAARRILDDGRRAALAALFLFATFGMGWLVQTRHMDTALLAALCCAYLWADTRALMRGGYIDYALLGIVTGLGVLASYSFLILPFAMSVALVFTPDLRARLRLAPLALAALLAPIVVLPYFLLAPDGFAFSAGTALVIATLRIFPLALLLFALPGVLGFVTLYPRACTPLAPQDRERTWLRFLKITMVVALIAALAGMLLVRASDAKAGWVYPVLLPLPVYLFMRAKLAYAESRERSDRLFAGFVLLCVVAAIGLRVWMYQTRAHDCRHCAEYWPLARYADTFRQAGFLGGTIAAPDAALGGNLRLVFPDARVVTPDAPAAAFGAPVPGECLVVWEGDGNVPQRLGTYVQTTYGAKLKDRALQGDVEAPLLTSKGRLARMNFLILAQGACDRPRG